MAPAFRPEELKKEWLFGLDAGSIRGEFLTHLAFALAELPEHVDIAWEPYRSLALTVHDRLIERWVHTQNVSDAHDAKCLYYLPVHS